MADMADVGETTAHSRSQLDRSFATWASSLTLRLTGSGIDKYPAKSHARRVAAKLQAKSGVVLIKGARLQLWPDSDMPVPFRQDRYFYYLTGCNEHDCYVTYDLVKDLLTLWLPPIDQSRVVWTGRGSTIAEAMELYDIDEARYISPEFLETTKMDRCGMLFVPSLTSQSFDSRDQPHSVFHPFEAVWEERTAEVRRLRSALDASRVIKDEHEIALIRQASDISSAAHKAVLEKLHRLTSEAEVEAEYMRVCIASRAKEQAYSPIAGSGPNAGILHYASNNEDFGDRQMLVLDAGCEWHCYASDITRTMPLNKTSPGHWPSKETEQIYKLVEKVQEACISRMCPGASFAEITRTARRLITGGLIDLGILKGETEEVLQAGSWFAFFPHGLGHQMGLEVHDVVPISATSAADVKTPLADTSLNELFKRSGLPPLPGPFEFRSARAVSKAEGSPGSPAYDLVARSESPLRTAGTVNSALEDDPSILKPGMVVTVEPGVYFNKDLLLQFLKIPELAKHIDEEVLVRYMRVGGVRIEDDILVTKDGYENLTSALKGEEMLRCIRRGAEEKL